MANINNFRLQSNKNDQLFKTKIFYQEIDDSSEHVDKLLQTVSRDVSTMLENSSTSDTLLCQINNIYVISNFNASVVNASGSSFRKDPTTNTNKKIQTKKSKESVCNTSEVKSTTTAMPEYFQKAGNTGRTTFILKLPTTIQTTENNLEITYHYPSKINV